jgi:5-methyltetrahydropteroyltriglutamate--homocysteine methyltransferase
MSVNPPFRADVVGSFLRTDAIHEARTAHEAGTLDDEALRRIEDAQIVDLIRKE